MSSNILHTSWDIKFTQGKQARRRSSRVLWGLAPAAQLGQVPGVAATAVQNIGRSGGSSAGASANAAQNAPTSAAKTRAAKNRRSKRKAQLKKKVEEVEVRNEVEKVEQSSQEDNTGIGEQRVPSMNIDGSNSNAVIHTTTRQGRARATKRASLHVTKPRKSFQRQMEQKRKMQAIKEQARRLEQERREERKAEARRLDQKRKAKEERQKANYGVQVIKNPAKLKKLNRKQLRLLMKVP